MLNVAGMLGAICSVPVYPVLTGIYSAARGIITGAAATGSDRLISLRTQLWWACATLLAVGSVIIGIGFASYFHIQLLLLVV